MKLIFPLALASVVALSGAAHAQTSALVTGWNYVKATNCVFVPGTPAVSGTPATTDQMDVYVDIVQPAPAPGAPPPPPDAAEFSTTDAVAIGVAVPFCKDGSAFYVYWDGTKALYFSLYPH